MGHIRKRGTSWQARYRAKDGKERTKSFRRQIDAKTWLSEQTADKSRGTWTDPQAGRITFGDWVTLYRATSLGDIKPSSKARYDQIIDNQLLPAFQQVPIALLDHQYLRVWAAGIDRAPATVQLILGLLDKIMAAAVMAGKIPSNPVRGVPRPRIVRDEMRFLTPAEVEKLAEAIHPRYRALVLLGAYGGLRIGELSGLRRRDVQDGVVRIEQIATEVHGNMIFGSPKSASSRRAVRVPVTTADALTEHLAAQGDREPGDLVFTAAQGGAIYPSHWRVTYWQPAVQAVGLSPLRPHDLRHTAVAIWIAAGLSPLEIARRAGHTSTSFTLDRYGHLFPDMDSQAADKIEAFVSRGQTADRAAEVQA